MAEQMGVEAESVAYRAMKGNWPLIADLRAGTDAMRAAGEDWLPKEPRESKPSYEVRLNRSFLYGAYRDAVAAIVAKPFSRAVTTKNKDKLPEQLQKISMDADRDGSDLTQFGKGVYRGGVNDGLRFIYVDYPLTGTGVNLEQQERQDIRPYFVDISAQDLTNYKTKKNETGKRELTMITIRERVTVDDGEFGEEQITQYRVVYAPGHRPARRAANDQGGEEAQGGWEVWRQGEGTSKKFVLYSSGTHTYPGIPLVPYYTEKTGFMRGEPPMMDLAWLNLMHWQSASDQRNILRFVRFAMLKAVGVTEEEKKRGFTLSPKTILYSVNKDANFGFVEHTGEGVKAGRQDLLDIQALMEVMGLQPLIEKSGNVTATGKAIDEGKKYCRAQEWCRSLEDALREAYRMAGVWVEDEKYELPEDFTVDIFTEFSLAAETDRDLDILLKLRQMMEIDSKTLLQEVQRRTVLHDTHDLDKIIELTKQEREDKAAMFAEFGAPTDEGGEGGEGGNTNKGGDAGAAAA